MSAIASPRPRRHQPTSKTPKELVVIAWLLGGWLGMHRIVLGQFVIGCALGGLNFVTCGVSGLFSYLDGFLLLLGTTKDSHGLPVVWSWQRGRLQIDPLEEGTYTAFESALRIAAHVGALFLLPYLVIAGSFALESTAQVRQSAGRFLTLSILVSAPLLALQITGGVRRARAQLALLRTAAASTRRTRLDAVARAVQIITPRGFLVLLTGLTFLTLSLLFHWAQLGVVAILALSAFYIISAVTSVYSSFIVRQFSDSLLHRGATVQRRYEPPVARVGDTVRDTLDVKGVPVPPGYFLTVQGTLSPRLATEVRHVVPTKSRDERVLLAVPLARTPRGTYDAPPLRIAFTDLLGITSATVASLATARIRILPAVRPAEVVPPPHANTPQPDPLLKPHRFPTEDLFRFREYIPGDDTRRIHWEMSLKAGRMIVKTPESRESSSKRVVVALDTWVPHEWLDHTAVLDDALDSLVEAWLAIAQRLIAQGEQVTLVLVARGEDGELHTEALRGEDNHALALDAGARAEWQAETRVEQLLDRGSSPRGVKAKTAAFTQPVDVRGTFDNAIVVTMLLTPPAPMAHARETTWVHYDPMSALGPPPRSVLETWLDFDDSGRKPTARAIAKRLLFLPHPVGAEENGVMARVRHLERRIEERAHRSALRQRAQLSSRQARTALLASPDAVYQLEIVHGHHRLVGLKAGLTPAQARQSA